MQVIAPSSQNTVLSSSLLLILNNGVAPNFVAPFGTLTTSSLVESYDLPQIGRALLFKLKTQLSPTPSECNADTACQPRSVSILSLLGWNLNKSESEFAFIQRNTGSDGQIPQKLLCIERNSIGDYVFTSEKYVFLRLRVKSEVDNDIAGNVVKVKSENPNDTFANLGFFTEDKQGANQRTIEHLFAKIRLNATNPNRSLFFSQSIKYFYYQPFRRLRDVIVEIVDRNGTLVNVRTDFNFTMEISEVQDVLKESLKDTRNGSKVITGLRALDHNF